MNALPDYYNTPSLRGLPPLSLPMPKFLVREREAELRRAAAARAKAKPTPDAGKMTFEGMARKAQADKATQAKAAVEERVKSSFRTRDDLRNMPDPEPLVDGYLYLDSVARLVGPPGSYKSFLALDWAASVVTGRPWHGKAVTGGKVVYLVGEGVRGIDSRLKAWELSRNEGLPADVDVFDGIVDLAGAASDAAEWVILGRIMQSIKPALIVIDTQARYTPGHEENSATDMSVLIHNLDLLRRITGACVLIVHHNTRGTEHARGSTAIEGGVQTELLMVKDKRGAVRLKTVKQKDIEEPDPLPLLVAPVEGTGSIVLDAVGTGATGDPFDVLPPRIHAESPYHERLAAVMYRVFDHGKSGANKAEAKAALQGDTELRIDGDTRKLSRRFSQAWATLEGRNCLEPMMSAATGNPVQRFKITADYAAELGLDHLDETS